MKTNNVLSLVIIIINVIGIICLVYFAIPYLIHDTALIYPDAMLPAKAWDRAGMILTIGFFPLVTANTIGYLFVRTKAGYVRLLFFVPSILCLVIAASYWFGSMLS